MHKRIPIVLGLILVMFAVWVLITPNKFISGVVERLDQRNGQPLVASDLGVVHQLRQLEGGGPLAGQSPALDLGEIVLSAPLISQQRSEADVHEDRDANDRQRDQKELNSEGGRGGQ